MLYSRGVLASLAKPDTSATNLLEKNKIVFCDWRIWSKPQSRDTLAALNTLT
jgi:hypothetical protein